MRNRFRLLAVMFLIFGLGMAGCSSPASQPAAAEPAVPEVAAAEAQPVPTEKPVDPETVTVMSMLERVNAEDYAGAAEFFADDALIYLVGMPPTGMEIYRGKEQYHTFLEECCTGQNFVYEVTPDQVEDSVVYAEGKTWMDFTRELGVAPNNWHELYEVRDGKITKYVSTITEESLTKFKPALREVLPELFETPPPANETPATEINVTIADGTCTANGPMALQAGELTVNVDVQDQTAEKYAVSLFTLDADKDMFDLMASTHRDGPPAWSRTVFLKELKANESQTYKNFIVNEGLLYMVCWSGPPDIPIGNAGPFTVSPVPEPAVDPEATVVMSMLERVNAQDYAGAAAFFADDALIYLVGMPPTGMEIYRGKEQYRTFLEECCTDQNFVYEVTPDHVKDGVVFAEGKTWMDFTRELGVAPNSWHELYEVKDGKITKYVSTITEESLTIFKPALRKVLPELFETVPQADDTPATEINVTIADGTCTASGPMALQAGELTLNVDVQDQTAEKYAVSFFTLDADKDMFDLMASSHRPSPPSWATMIFLKEYEPNEIDTDESLQIEEGLLYMVCWSSPPDIPIGNAGPFEVEP